MFTGIITGIGRITEVQGNDDKQFVIQTPRPLEALNKGASIACSGVCLTALEYGKDWFSVYVSRESMSRTTLQHWQVDTPINLERSLRAGDELGGHIVTGHVDGIGSIASITREGESYHLVFQAPLHLMPFIAEKGSVAIDGISLTVNNVETDCFHINIIPHTWEHTTLQYGKVGTPVNIEVDILARYVARQFSAAKALPA